MKKGKIRKTRCSWPPPDSDMEEDEDDDDPDGDTEGCDFCHDSKSFNPQLAWNAFYMDANSLRNSWRLGRFCRDPGWEWFEEETVDEVTEKQEKVQRSVAAQFSSSSSQPNVSSGTSSPDPPPSGDHGRPF